MWGVSWANVSMMMADAQRTDYERDKKDAPASGDNDVLDLSNLEDIEKLKRMAR